MQPLRTVALHSNLSAGHEIEVFSQTCELLLRCWIGALVQNLELAVRHGLDTEFDFKAIQQHKFRRGRTVDFPGRKTFSMGRFAVEITLF
jgi:hypothetical protein